MNLYEISNEYLATAQQLAELDLDEQTITDTLEAAQWPVEEKGRALSAVILNMRAEADMVNDAIKKLSHRAKAIESRAQALHDYLLINMQRTGITEIKALDGTFKAKLYRERDANVIIDSDNLIPADYMREIPARCEPDKVLIKKAINDGYEVPGAHIVKKDRLEIK
jgi:hypothetical protein